MVWPVVPMINRGVHKRCVLVIAMEVKLGVVDKGYNEAGDLPIVSALELYRSHSIGQLVSQVRLVLVMR